MYGDIGESGMAADYTRKAYELRDRTSESEKDYISASFHMVVTGNTDKAEQTCELWMRAYPRADIPHDFLSGLVYPILGQHEKAVEEATEAIRLNPDFSITYYNLMLSNIALNRLDEAKATYEHALERKLDFPFFHFALYQIAFVQNDVAAMAQHVAWATGKPGVEDVLLDFEANTAGYSGRLGKSRELSRRAVVSVKQGKGEETEASYEASAALREALFGDAREARQRAAAALALSTGRDVQYGTALALALAGHAARAQALANDLGKRFPEDTIVQFNCLPTLHAQFSLSHDDASRAIELLQPVVPYELGSVGSTALYPVFVRGEAY